MHAYTYTSTGGWTPCGGGFAPPALWLPPDLTTPAALRDWLFSLGYKRQAQTYMPRCNIGHFVLWGYEGPEPARPQFAIEITQVDVESVVWIADLPDLWSFIATYAPIGALLQRTLPGEEPDEDDDEDEDAPAGPRCPDCGEPMRLVLHGPAEGPLN